MDSESEKSEDHVSLEDIFQLYEEVSSSSETSISRDPSVLYVDEKPKMKLFLEGLYNPGSGEICNKYVTMSRSSVLRHQYYQYPSVKDPGIEEALLHPEKPKIYGDDGQELYLDLCKEMNIIPVRMFHRGLKTKSINLRYYGVNPVGVRAMCLALASNQTVECLDLTSNFLEYPEAVYHLGQLLGERNAIQELILSGCNIGHEGVRMIAVYLAQRSMSVLDLSQNNILDKGILHLTAQIQQGAIIRRLNLRRNDLTSNSLTVLAEVLQFHPVAVQYLDLSWNKFLSKRGPATLFRVLGLSHVLVELNMAWSSLSVVKELGYLLGIKTLKVLDLSHNKLGSRSAHVLAGKLVNAKNLKILDLSSNPFTPSDALYLLSKMKLREVKLKQLLMDHILVSKEFAIELEELKQLKSKKKTIITHGDILRNYTLTEHDFKAILMNRLVLVMSKKKHMELDILLYFMEQNKIRSTLEASEFSRILKHHQVPIQDDFIQEFVNAFSGPKTAKAGAKLINTDLVVDYIRRLWPDKKLPPTPPPLPPALPPGPRPPKTKKKMGKKKK